MENNYNVSFDDYSIEDLIYILYSLYNNEENKLCDLL